MTHAELLDDEMDGLIDIATAPEISKDELNTAPTKTVKKTKKAVEDVELDPEQLEREKRAGRLMSKNINKIYSKKTGEDFDTDQFEVLMELGTALIKGTRGNKYIYFTVLAGVSSIAFAPAIFNFYKAITNTKKEVKEDEKHNSNIEN